ncbi:MAG: AAA family ATPase, partial [Thermoguttaceae bacterium]|nr:AAA family ATPase [Thermoguttaceae bacterium]
MKITSFEIERFGIWEHLSLPNISRGLNVFYGPNEAGKTTLMQFFRSCLYGCDNDDRSQYIQMVLNSKKFEDRLSQQGQKDHILPVEQDPDYWVGGSVLVESGLGVHRIERRYIKRGTVPGERQSTLEIKSGFIATGGLADWSGRFYTLPGKGIAESLVVSGPDGTRLSDYFVKTLVNDVDEATFNNVFAIGLDELQRLGTLNETDAAEMLYRLSVGVDRISLVQVLHQLVNERNEIFDAKGHPGILDGLIERRDRFAQKNLEAAADLREYSRLLAESRELKDALSILLDKIEKLSRQKRLYELAKNLAPTWNDRNCLRDSITAMGHVIAVDAAALDQSNVYATGIADVRHKLDLLRADYLKTKNERNALVADTSIRHNAPRIELLLDELPRLEQIDSEMVAINEELAVVQGKLTNEELRLRGARHGKMLLTQGTIQSLQPASEQTITSDHSGEKTISENGLRFSVSAEEEAIKEVDDFRIPARAVVSAKRKLVRHQEQLDQAAEQLGNVSGQLEASLTSRRQRNVSEAIEYTNELLVALKKRSEVARRFNDLSQYRKELEYQNTHLTNNQSLPTGALFVVGLGVIAGGLVFALSLMNRFEPGYGILGLLLAVGCALFKTAVERRNFANLQENQRQLGTVVKQAEQVKQDIQAIDTRFPGGTQSPDVRLQKAQSDLAFFEKLVPLDTQWKETKRRHQLMERRVARAQENVTAARSNWRHWLKAAGLPKGLKPSHIKELLGRVDVMEELRRQLLSLRDRLDLCQRERRGILDHLDRVTVDTNLKMKDLTPAKMIVFLKDRLDEARMIEKERRALDQKLLVMFRERRKLRRQERGVRAEWREFLRPYGANKGEDLTRLAGVYKDYLARTERLASLEQRLLDGLGDFCPLDEVEKLLTDTPNLIDLDEELDRIATRIDAFCTERDEKLEHTGRLDEQMKVLASKRDPLRNQFERASTELRIRDVASLWQSRAVACRMMEDIRKAYERERQPETLREASDYLSVLTTGKYVKIWTPLGDDTLFVDDDEGRTLDIAHLSRGTREQLFIAIRLALTMTFEKHGISLPLILDDVLVNFDNRRARAAAKLLYKFAQNGHQVFLFTCHEHICRIFLELATPVHVLPSRRSSDKHFRVILPSALKRKSKAPLVHSAKSVKAVPRKTKEEYLTCAASAIVTSAPEIMSVADAVCEVDPAETNARPATEFNDYRICDVVTNLPISPRHIVQDRDKAFVVPEPTRPTSVAESVTDVSTDEFNTTPPVPALVKPAKELRVDGLASFQGTAQEQLAFASGHECDDSSPTPGVIVSWSDMVNTSVSQTTV